jgi:3-oxoacyl-[acyl-carrier-protein] synthase III
MLLVAEGGARPVQDAIQPRKRRRWPSSLYMDGPELVKFSLDIAPPLIDSVLARAQWTRDQIDMYLIHQATLFMLDHLRDRLSLDREHTPEALEDYGNTVSSTIPILIRDLRESGRLRPGKQTLLMGFGVGLSWAGCVWTERWAAEQVQVGTTADKNAEKPVEPPDDPTPGPSSETQPRSGDASADSREAA